MPPATHQGSSCRPIRRRASTPAGTFTDTLGVRAFNTLDGSKDVNSYARNVGLVHDGPLLVLNF